MIDRPFNEARDVQSIRYRFHPLDIGFDLRLTGHTVVISRVDDPLQVSYPDENGNCRVMDGPQEAVIARLRELGFDIELELTSVEAANILGLAPSTTRNAAAAGKVSGAYPDTTRTGTINPPWVATEAAWREWAATIRPRKRVNEEA